TVPAIWKEAGIKGRDTSDVIIMVVTFVLAYLFLLYGAQLCDGQVDQNFGTWLIAGRLIGLGMIVPGLSPSNFLVYMGLY
ncbi:undecaprenyl phosphate translocase family protein, partial [Enterococcus faecium]|uniref:undecaprenyl phosphate translocase family protein n=1 Tax=Enterococcus faecium TaxID=1352 RepID=UPI003CC65DD9